jgi:hypothetical protein
MFRVPPTTAAVMTKSRCMPRLYIRFRASLTCDNLKLIMVKLKAGIVSLGVTCLTVVSLLAVYTILGSAQAPIPKPLAPLPAPNCSFSVKSFCTTESSMKQYVTTGDFSDVLESQVPVDVVCNGASQLQQYCQPNEKGAVMQLFQVRQQNMGLMTRNQYITFFMDYVAAHGAFTFVSAKTDGNDIVMSFQSQTGAYTLLFVREGSNWKVSYPSVGVVQ